MPIKYAFKQDLHTFLFSKVSDFLYTARKCLRFSNPIVIIWRNSELNESTYINKPKFLAQVDLRYSMLSANHLCRLIIIKLILSR
jgi:hypothetical protein